MLRGDAKKRFDLRHSIAVDDIRVVELVLLEMLHSTDQTDER